MDAEGQRLLARLPELLAVREAPAVLVTVWRTEGSAPRSTGARMLCRQGRLLAGTIGGGHLEEQALRDAQALEDGHESHDVDESAALATEVRDEANHEGRLARVCRYPLGSQLAQCCGGQVWLHFQRLDHALAVAMANALKVAEAADVPLESQFGDEVLAEQPQPLPTVLICGAGHVSAALARVLQPMPWRVVVVDHRPMWAEPFRFPPGIEVVCTEPMRLLAAWGWLGPEAQASQAAGKLTQHGRALPRAPKPEATQALVMTHDHALDRELSAALLGCHKGRLPYVGLIGSQSKIRATHQRLRQRGVDDATLARLVGPIGLRVDGELLGGKLPGEIAISVAAQLLAARR
jgi:xanthine dehydrogenase accessory factor